MYDAFSRMENLLGTKGVKRLGSAKIAVFGIGGIGSYVVEALARCGVGSLTLVDNEDISLTDINRQLYALRSAIGRKKVQVAKEHIRDIDEDILVHTYETYYSNDTAGMFDLKAYDYIVDAMNSLASKILLIEQAKELVAAGAKELILVAQETTLYGVDLYGEKSLHRLLDELNKIEDLFWIRIMYCYPEEIYEGLIDAMIRNKKVCHYLDIPIQHTNDTILKRMGRRTSNADLVKIITHLRERIPDITLRTTLICGFPGETQEMHEELMQFINDMEFDRLGAFTYSPEEGTPAAEFTDQVDENLKKDWQADVMELQEEIIFDKNETMKGRELYVFIEGKVSDENAYVGRTYRDAPDVDGYIFINTDEELMTGDIAKVRVTGAYEYDLIGELI